MPACAICKKPFDPNDESARTVFCSERCRLLDLANWLGGRYVVAGASPFDESLAELGAELGSEMSSPESVIEMLNASLREESHE